MRYTETELKAMSYPINDGEKERCLAVLELVKNLCLKLNYKLDGNLLGGQSAADYIYNLTSKNDALTLKVMGGHAENTLGKKSVSIKIAVIASNRDCALQIKEELGTALQAYGANVKGNCFLEVCLGSSAETFRLMFGYGKINGEVYFLRADGMDSLRYLAKDMQELQRKNMATNYGFKKLIRIVKTIGPEVQKSGIAEKGICYVKLTHILSNLPDSDYIRFDNLPERLSYIVLRAVLMLEKKHDLKECNSIKPLFKDEQEQQKYLNFMEAFRKWLV